ncbi:HGGxSTG domain-containing protein [Alphaproteobacteria bacterium]|nr:HGGxSTG domain-containing protein [Alphaproteobacteria bacterium]
MFTKNNVTIGLEWRFGPSWPGQRCFAKTRRGSKCQRPANKRNGRCRLHGGASTGPRTEDGKARISAANMRHGKFTKEKLKDRKTNAAAGRAIRKELCHIESQLIQRGLLEKHWQDKFFS